MGSQCGGGGRSIAGGVGGLVGDVALPWLGLGLLLLWVTSMVVVGGVVAAMGALFGWRCGVCPMVIVGSRRVLWVVVTIGDRGDIVLVGGLGGHHRQWWWLGKKIVWLFTMPN